MPLFFKFFVSGNLFGVSVKLIQARQHRLKNLYLSLANDQNRAKPLCALAFLLAT